MAFTDRIDFGSLSLDAAKPESKIKWTESGQLDDQTVAIFWNCPAGLVKEAADYIQSTYRSLNNGELPFVKLSGYWRSGGVSYSIENEKGKVVLVLHKGYVTAIDWTTAKIENRTRATGNSTSISGVESGASDSSLHHVFVRLQYFDPKTVNAVLAGLNTGTKISSPTVMTETLMGDWYVHYAMAKIEEDTSASVYLALGIERFCIHTVHDRLWWEEVDVWYLYETHYGDVQTIIDDFLATYPNGSYATVDNSYDRKTCTLVLSTPTGREITGGRVWYDIQPYQIGSGTETWNQTSATVSPSSAAAGYMYEVESRKTKAGKYICVSGVKSSISGSGTYSGSLWPFESEEVLWFKNTSEPLEQASGAFGVVVNRANANAFGRLDGESILRTPISGSGSYSGMSHEFENQATYWFRNISGTPPTVTATSGITIPRANTNDFGLLDGETTLRVPLLASGSYSAASGPFLIETHNWFRNATEPVTLSVTGDDLAETNGERNEFQLYDGKGRKLSPQSGSGSVDLDENYFNTRKRTWFRNYTTPPTGLSSANDLTDIDARPNEFALLDGDVDVVTPKAHSGTTSGGGNYFFSSANDWFRNVASGDLPTPELSGVMSNMDARPNEFGLLDGMMDTRYPTAREWSGYIHSDDQSRIYEVRKWNQDTVDAPASGETMSVYINPFGKFDSVNRKTEAAASSLIGTSSQFIQWGGVQHIVTSSYYFTEANRKVWFSGTSSSYTLRGWLESDPWVVPAITSTPLIIAYGKWKFTHVFGYEETEAAALAKINEDTSGADILTEYDGEHHRINYGLWRYHKLIKTFEVLQTNSSIVTALYSGAMGP
jgi:hypothetical protein